MNNLELYLAERTQFFSIYRMACQTTIERMDPGRISFCLTGGRCEGDAISRRSPRDYGKRVGTSCRQQSRSADNHVVMASGRCSKLQPNRDTHRTPPKIPAGMEAVCDDGRASNRERSQRI
jgi:hypothetical protein